MLQTEHITINGIDFTYRIFGERKINLVIEMGLGAVIGEWLHVAEKLASEYTVLLYERSRNADIPRTPENIAAELHALLQKLGCAEKIAIVAHSQGGLYAQQFVRMYPDTISGIVLLDPLSANDKRYKELLTPQEQKKSGFDKSSNLVIMEKLARLHLGFIIKSVMKKAPPFYYYNGFSTDASEYILNAITKPELYKSAVAEYSLAHEDNCIDTLRKKNGFPDIPLVLITHTTEFSIRETMEFGHTTREFAEKVEDIWQSLMKEYLLFSTKSKWLQAKNSGHFIHLTEPELINDGLLWIKENV